MFIKDLIKRLRGILLFGIFYLVTFFLIESRDVPIHIIHTKFDDYIPFCEYFIIPYVLWYLYVAGTVLYLGLTDKSGKEYHRFIINMILGMVIFVIVSFLYPNGQDLRPVFASDNIFKWLVNVLYAIDTPTNILPSLHVYASVACDIALCQNSKFKTHPSWRWMSHVLTIIIILSTVFLKQHSIVDIITALILNLVFYLLVYRKGFENISLK